MNHHTLKEALFRQCQAFVQQRLDNARQAMQAAQEAANSETKSSAGDKYETGRAMMQLEKERLSGQLAEAQKLQQALDQVVISKTYDRVQTGSLVFTSQGNFFIAISAGKIMVEQQTFFAISPASPIGQQLNSRQAGHEIVFNHRIMKIEEVI